VVFRGGLAKCKGGFAGHQGGTWETGTEPRGELELVIMGRNMGVDMSESQALNSMDGQLLERMVVRKLQDG